MAAEQNIHLSAEGIQAFLEGELPGKEAIAAREHASSCVRCRTEVEAFQLLFAELGELPELAPSEHFAERVMAALPVALAKPLASEPEAELAGGRLRGWLRGWIARGESAPSGHPTSERLQDFVEGLIPVRQRGGIEAHVAACGDCEAEVAQWSELFRDLGALPELAPAADFRERVMAKVRVPPAVAPAPVRDARSRAIEWAGRLRPRTAKGWAVAGGIALSPGVAFAAVTYMIVSHPLLTFGYLAAFLWWQVSGALSALAAGVGSQVVESVTAFQAYSAIEALVTSPATAALGLVTFAGLMMAALWILYRNLILPTLVADHDARSAH